MSTSFLLTPCNSFPQRHKGVAFLTPRAPLVSAAPPRLSNLPPVRSLQGQGHQPLTPAKPRWENLLATAASLYPLYVTFGGAVACFRPSTFSWFVNKAPLSYSFSLGFIMLAMGLTLELRDLFDLLMQRPVSILFGCVAQYTIMPAFGMIISKLLGLPPSISVGLILLSCCPGGTASNVCCR